MMNLHEHGKENDMETESNEAQLNKIRGLLAKAESTDFEGERETYMAKAMELISKWGIDKTLLEAKTKTSVIGDRIFKIYPPFARNKVTFFNAIVNALGGRAIWINSRQYAGKPYEQLHVFGTATDLMRIDMLFTSLLVQCTTAMLAESRNSYAAQRSPRKWKSDFLYGFTCEVGLRLARAERLAAERVAESAKEQGMSTALVLVAKKDQVDRAVADRYKSVQERPNRGRELGDGYYNGTAAGKRADLGETRISTGQRGKALAS